MFLKYLTFQVMHCRTVVLRYIQQISSFHVFIHVLDYLTLIISNFHFSMMISKQRFFEFQLFNLLRQKGSIGNH